MKVEKDEVFTLRRHGADIIKVRALRSFNDDQEFDEYTKYREIYNLDSYLDWYVSKGLLEVLRDHERKK